MLFGNSRNCLSRHVNGLVDHYLKQLYNIGLNYWALVKKDSAEAEMIVQWLLGDKFVVLKKTESNIEKHA